MPRVQTWRAKAIAAAREAAWRLKVWRSPPRGSPLDGHISRKKGFWKAARSANPNASAAHWGVYFKPLGAVEPMTQFLRRAEDSRSRTGWSLSADEALDERHPLLAMAFAYRMAELHWEDKDERLTRAIAEQIVNRLSGRRSEAPSEEWFEGFAEDTVGFDKLRRLVEILGEARAIEDGLSKAESSRMTAAVVRL